MPRAGPPLSMMSPIRVALGVILGIVASVVLRIAPNDVRGNHPYQPHKHIYSINQASEYEHWCVSAQTDRILNAEAFEGINEALRGFPPIAPTVPWESIRRVDFRGLYGCWEGNPEDLDDPAFKIYFYIRDDVSSDCGTYAACANWYQPFFDPLSLHPEAERRLSKIWISTDSFLNDQLTVVNHETGHALGLRDGDAEDNDCFPVTIMHCPGQEWPSEADKASVDSLIPPDFTDGGGFASKFVLG